MITKKKKKKPMVGNKNYVYKYFSKLTYYLSKIEQFMINNSHTLAND
jgi:hypothetical protein